jgi:hypothetical protein
LIYVNAMCVIKIRCLVFIQTTPVASITKANKMSTSDHREKFHSKWNFEYILQYKGKSMKRQFKVKELLQSGFT